MILKPKRNRRLKFRTGRNEARGGPVMTHEPKRIFVGHLPSGGVTYVAEGEIDPVARLIADANAQLDAERAAEAKALAAKAADVERAKATRAARVTKRFRQAFKLFARTR
jgi:hypothetical protein